jgi:hypothetical protein
LNGRAASSIPHFGSINDGDTGPHFGDNRWVFERGLSEVGWQLQMTGGEGGHDGAFSGIAIATAADYRDEALLGTTDF